jgi:mannose-6-phosphate isomerase
MAIEYARTHALPKPWGVADLRPWSNARHNDVIGEIWYERRDRAAANTSLLLKLLFTSQPLSIQVHPDDAAAQSMGLPRGKSEAWYILSATPEAKVALGLKQRVTQQHLREAVDDGSVANLIAWRAVSAGDVVFVPAGTIHAIGAGLVIAEIQQRSDATFRLFDFGRQRELHIESAVAVANAQPTDCGASPNRLTKERTLLVSSSHFVFEKIDLPPDSDWCLEAEQETWLLVVNGSARAGSFDVAIGDAVFAQSDRLDMHTGTVGMVGLVAYTGGGDTPRLLQRLKQPGALDARPPAEMPASLTPAKVASTNGRLDTTK